VTIHGGREIVAENAPRALIRKLTARDAWCTRPGRPEPPEGENPGPVALLAPLAREESGVLRTVAE